MRAYAVVFRLCLPLLGVAWIIHMTSGTPLAQEPAVTHAERSLDVPGAIRLVLPPVLHAVEGLETNIYFDNVVLTPNPRDFVFDVTCSRGQQQAERWTYVPGPNEAGDCEFRLDLRDAENAIIAHGRTTLRVVARDAGAGRPVSMLIVGDSLTHASVYPQHLVGLCEKPGNPSLNLVGSFIPRSEWPKIRHEGYGGWTAQRFTTHYTGTARQGHHSKRGSPFLYVDAKGNKRLDFSRYCQEFNAGKPPHVVAIFLGCNDTFAATDETIEPVTNTMFKHYDALVAAVHGYSKDTWIAAMLPAPPAATQDAFGANYRCGQTRWQYKRNQHRLMERMLERYANREKEHLYVVPIHVNLDCSHNYPSGPQPWNARADIQTDRLSNGVHPAASGYRQIGDSLYAWLKVQLASP